MGLGWVRLVQLLHYQKGISMRSAFLYAAVTAAALPLGVSAATGDIVSELEEVQVTATRVAEPVDRLPAQVTIITGDELRARGAVDLRTALSMVAGVDAPPGGDAGNASAVPSIWGLHEFDAFLLVVDGVPWGGAFNPSIPTLDLNDVERIEVLKGAAPVVYGATAFVGVVQIIHYPAGKSSNDLQVGYGSFGSMHASGSIALPAIGAYQQSVAISGEKQQYSDPREGINNGKLLYRGAAAVGGGTLRVDADVTSQRQAPASPVIFNGSGFANPIDANYNPADARIDEHRYHLVLAYSHDTPLGQWDSTASYAHSNISDVRGFLRPDPTPNPDPTDPDFNNNADYMNQDRGIIDSYFETHLAKTIARGLDLVYGADLLYGSGKQQSSNGAYCAGGAEFGCPPGKDQVPPQATGDRPIDEINGTNDRRAFFGEFVQANWKPDARWTVLGGLRLNETHERNTFTHIDTADATNDTLDAESKNKTRLSGTLGASYQAWARGSDEAVLYTDYRNTFKPAALDFGPDVPTPSILDPEAARSYEGGIKGRLAGGRLDYDVSLFYLHFNNLVVASTDAAGDPVMRNAGSEIFKGLEFETRYHVYRDLSVGLNYSYHDAKYVKFIDDEGNSASGKNLELSPHNLASYGFYYDPKDGLNASFTAAYIGNRYLDAANTASINSYTTLDGSLGYRFRRFRATLNGYNLTDERKPVTNSEFGDSSFYFLPARSVFLNLGMDLRGL
jgi:outer membrane receptor protein involved in Fe transport